MVFCPPRPVQPSSPGPDLGQGPADPFLDLEPSEDGLAPPLGAASRAIAAHPEATAGLTQPRRSPKRMRLVIAAGLTVPLTLGAVAPHSWWSDGHSGRHLLPFTRSAAWGAIKSPGNVIIQARARQRRRQRRIIIAAAAAGAAAGRAAAGSGSPPRHRQRSVPPAPRRHTRAGHDMVGGAQP
jgi:hypothetical protein